jgi:hypothetical protein
MGEDNGHPVIQKWIRIGIQLMRKRPIQYHGHFVPLLQLSPNDDSSRAHIGPVGKNRTAGNSAYEKGKQAEFC